jgi:hypothetical protein
MLKQSLFSPSCERVFQLLILQKQKILPQFQNTYGFSYEYKLGQLTAHGALPKGAKESPALLLSISV